MEAGGKTSLVKLSRFLSGVRVLSVHFHRLLTTLKSHLCHGYRSIFLVHSTIETYLHIHVLEKLRYTEIVVAARSFGK